jgi:polyhydroxyalkanoate synthesis regulator phasin
MRTTITPTNNKKHNKLIKRASYWRNKCKTLEEAVRLWREIELDREGMLEIGDDKALIRENFYKFFDDLIDKERFSSPEKRALHKELIRAETNTLGKYNKRQDKRGIRKTKIFLEGSLTLANNLGKVKYEMEASLRSLPS